MIGPLSMVGLDSLGLKNPGVPALAMKIKQIGDDIDLLLDDGLREDGTLSHMQHLVVVQRGTEGLNIFGWKIKKGQSERVVGRIYTKRATVLDRAPQISKKKRDALVRLFKSTGREVSVQETI